MVHHSKRISFFRKPAFIGTSLFGSLLFLILQINYWQSIYAKNIVIDVKHDSLLFVQSKRKNSNRLEQSNYVIYPNVALKILKAIHHNPKINSLNQLCQLTSLDSAIILQTLTESVKKTKAKIYRIDLNSADSAEFEMLPGIGSKTARRIIRYRERLGGFINKYQLLEIKYFDSSLLLSNQIQFVVDLNKINKIDINHCDIVTLYKHPYIGKDFARIIWAYKNAHFPLTINKFNEMKGLSSNTSVKMTPYLIFQ